MIPDSETRNQDAETAAGTASDSGGLSGTASIPRLYQTPFIIIALCCAGPLALPLVWKRPNTSLEWKITVSVAVLLLTALLCWILYLAILLLIQMIREYQQFMQEL